MNKRKSVDIYGGPGIGKSTIATALFSELKFQGFNTEYIPEYAKAATWEKRGPKVFYHQEYIFAKQHFNMSRVADEVDFVVTDSPLLLGMVYTPVDYYLPSLRRVIWEAYSAYDHINIKLIRSDAKPYNPSGRHQDESGAITLDERIEKMLLENGVPFISMVFGRNNIPDIINIMQERGWLENPLVKLQHNAGI